MAVDLNRCALNAGFITGLVVEHFQSEAVLLSKARKHTQQHARPVLRLRAAGTCMQRQDSVVRIIFAAQQHAQLQMLQLVTAFFQQLVHLRNQAFVVFLSGQLLHSLEVANAFTKLMEAVDLFLQRINILRCFLCFFRIIPKSRITHFML